MGCGEYQISSRNHQRMNTNWSRVGVSPAFLISLYGNQYTPENVCEGMERLNSWGFSDVQIEIFDQEKLPLWLEGGGAKKVRQVQEKLGIHISQLVCHLLIDECTSRQSLKSDSGIQVIKEVIQIGQELQCCDCITLPVGSFKTNQTSGEKIDPSLVEELRTDLTNKLWKYFVPVKEAGYKLAVELLPNNIAGGYSGFSNICADISPDRIGLLFDTGHAWVGGEDVVAIPSRYGNRIFGTHLCDNFGEKNEKLPPGKGSIRWKDLIHNLQSATYAGFYDLEIMCRPEEVEEVYRSGRDYIVASLN